MSAGSRFATGANALSLLRLLLLPFLVAAILSGAARAAALLLALAVASDFADGWVARRSGAASAFGRLVDHGVDAVFVAVGAAALAWRGVVPAALPALIAVAFAQYAFDGGRAAPRPSALGRWNGIGYYVVLAVPLLRDALGLAWPGPAWVTALAWLLVATTLASILDRARFTLRPP